MNDIDRQYRNLLREILHKGKEDFNKRTGSTVKAISGHMLRVDLEHEFPLISLRPIPVKTFVAETLFYLQGTTDPTWLQQFTKIWDKFLSPQGDMPDSYGYRWRHAFGRDQIEQLIGLLKLDPSSRHGVVAIWDPRTDGLMGEPKPNIPCPISFTAQIVGGRLDMCVTVRSQDCYLGLPTDVASFALLNLILAAHLGIKPGIYSHFICNGHLYANQYLNGHILSERVSKQQAMPIQMRQGVFLEAKYGEKALVEEIIMLILAKYRPMDKLLPVDIMI